MSKLVEGHYSMDIAKAVEGKIDPKKKQRIITKYNGLGAAIT